MIALKAAYLKKSIKKYEEEHKITKEQKQEQAERLKKAMEKAGEEWSEKRKKRKVGIPCYYSFMEAFLEKGSSPYLTRIYGLIYQVLIAYLCMYETRDFGKVEKDAFNHACDIAIEIEREHYEYSYYFVARTLFLLAKKNNIDACLIDKNMVWEEMETQQIKRMKKVEKERKKWRKQMDE